MACRAFKARPWQAAAQGDTLMQSEVIEEKACTRAGAVTCSPPRGTRKKNRLASAAHEGVRGGQAWVLGAKGSTGAALTGLPARHRRWPRGASAHRIALKPACRSAELPDSVISKALLADPGIEAV